MQFVASLIKLFSFKDQETLIVPIMNTLPSDQFFYRKINVMST